MSDETDKAANVLFDFIQSMHRWQREVAKKSRKLVSGDKEIEEELLKTLKAIYDSYIITPKAPKGLAWSSKPSYDPKTEKVVVISKAGKNLLVITDRTSRVPHMRIRYTLVPTKDGYKLKNRIERFNEFDKTFEKWDFML